ncbi:hypothetical protein WMY93_008706 [Mugilogobius chulae]|uniref:Uncharacterized protein n=1 Tax=Mugilogobius chulae TaxID=88201 RepID=A0AAW0PFV9_9GOBI
MAPIRADSPTKRTKNIQPRRSARAALSEGTGSDVRERGPAGNSGTNKRFRLTHQFNELMKNLTLVFTTHETHKDPGRTHQRPTDRDQDQDQSRTTEGPRTDLSRIRTRTRPRAEPHSGVHDSRDSRKTQERLTRDPQTKTGTRTRAGPRTDLSRTRVRTREKTRGKPAEDRSRT